MKSCQGTDTDGDPIDTNTSGTKTVTVNADDQTGNLSTKTVTYIVEERSAPAITILVPAEGGEVRRDAGWLGPDLSNGSAFTGCRGGGASELT